MSKYSDKAKILENIGEIIGLLEEKSLSRDWLLGELKRYKIKSNSNVNLNIFHILKKCNPQVIQKILNILKGDLVIRDVKALTRELHWFFIDIVSSADPNLTVKSQARKIYALNELIQRTDTFKNESPENLYILPTGDGMTIGFSDTPEKPLRLAIELHKLLKKFNDTQKEKDKINIRIGMNTGPVYFMKGIRGDIFWGPGLITAKRVMDLCEPNQIFASERIAKDLKDLTEENKATLHPVGEFDIKHNEKIMIYNIYGKEFGKKNILKPSKDSDDPRKNFEFISVRIQLEVTDLKSMMTHHTWIWNIKNTSKEPLTALFYDIGGDVPRDFSKLNVKVTDENNKMLDILMIGKDKPFQKQFHIKLSKPIKKNQTGRFVKLEYDWEEPDRNFGYSFTTKCKKFSYFFIAPKELQIKHKILEVIKGLGEKRMAEPPAKIRYLKDHTEVIWETSKKHKINPYDEFEFHW